MTRDVADQLPRPTIFVIIPPPLWAVIFLVMAWLAGEALGLEPVFKSRAVGFAIFLAGFIISASGRYEFARAGTEVIPASSKNSHLVTSGIFRFTRNPMYLGILIATVGIAMTIGTLAAYAAPVVFFLFVNAVSIPYEETKMERQFGEDYRAYKARVRRWL